ncbi:MAG: hypothetical protein RLZZ22_1904 [Pseudomonadota bacterium]|jgi:uncharacterized membrane protein
MDGEALFWLELALALPALTAALALKPWRMLRGPLLSPLLAALALLPWFWLLPQQLPQGLQIQFSGASLLALMLGWPLAVPVLALVALQVWALGLHDGPTVLSQWVWLGLVPATLALGFGALLRRWLPAHPFVYTLGRGFIGTALAVFGAGLLQELAQRWLAGASLHDALVARWLMAWGDAFLTGMFCSIFVAFAPQWLATWSDRRYLGPPSG